MTAIYSSVALKNRQREIKDIARKEIVHITENGNGAFVFCSEELFEKALEDAREQGAYETRLALALDKADRDLAEDRVYSDVKGARASAKKNRAKQ